MFLRWLLPQLCYRYVQVESRELKRRCARYVNPLLGDVHGLISFDEVRVRAATNCTFVVETLLDSVQKVDVYLETRYDTWIVFLCFCVGMLEILLG